MASSINKPILSDKASKVIILMVKPNIQMKVSVPSNAIGRVKPVIAVERNEPKNKSTIRTAKIPPSTIVRATSLILARIPFDVSTTTFKVVPLGSCCSILSSVL